MGKGGFRARDVPSPLSVTLRGDGIVKSSHYFMLSYLYSLQPREKQ